MIVRVAPGTILFHLRNYFTVLQPKGEKAGMTANGPFCQHRFKTSGGGSYPEFNGEIVGAEIACGVAEADLAVEAIEVKRLPNLAAVEGHSASQDGVVPANGISRVPIAFPPADQSGRKLNAS